MKRFTSDEMHILLQAGELLRREIGMVDASGETTPNAAELSWKFHTTSSAAYECTAAACIEHVEAIMIFTKPEYFLHALSEIEEDLNVARLARSNRDRALALRAVSIAADKLSREINENPVQGLDP